jgi:hypothetical protein
MLGPLEVKRKLTYEVLGGEAEPEAECSQLGGRQHQESLHVQEKEDNILKYFVRGKYEKL